MSMAYDGAFEILSDRVWRSYRGGAVLNRIEGSGGDDDHFPEDWVGSTTRAANAGREYMRDGGLF